MSDERKDVTIRQTNEFLRRKVVALQSRLKIADERIERADMLERVIWKYDADLAVSFGLQEPQSEGPRRDSDPVHTDHQHPARKP